MQNLQQQYLPILKNLVNGDYVYIDFPMHLNVGDSLIVLGALNLLKEIPHKCCYITSGGCFDSTKVRPTDIIILHGGGNFGDLYRGANEFRNEIVRAFPNNKIIIFPQTIWYNDMSYVSTDVEVFSQHPNLTILVRDEPSLRFASQHFTHNKVLLFPDTALFLPPLSIKRAPSSKILYLKRKDHELNLVHREDSSNMVTMDWDGILRKDKFLKIKLLIVRVLSFIRRKVPHCGSLGATLQNKYFIKHVTPYLYEIAAKEFCQYDKIISTRMHGSILALLLGIPLEIEDTKYKKAEGVIKQWFPEESKQLFKD